MLPAGSVAEYLKDGKPAAQDDPADRTRNGKYVRSLRDYRRGSVPIASIGLRCSTFLKPPSATRN